ncbi:hypothetical protein SO694_00074010 [Aureococcus anophagefferens]|uniref:Uncharacterized protein n=1 Tax=Aureococcus anophagefferens TaxID=44056 RepID=A0ABR1FHJ1_AURAN
MRAARRLLGSVAERRAARLAQVRQEVPSPVVEVRERVDTRCVVLEEATWAAPGACEELAALVEQWNANRLVKAVVVEGYFGQFAAADARATARLCKAVAGSAVPVAPLVDGLLLPGAAALCLNGLAVASDGAVFVPPLGAAARAPRASRPARARRVQARWRRPRAAALVSGLPVRGRALVAAGLASHVVTSHCLDGLAAERARRAARRQRRRAALEAVADARAAASAPFLDDACARDADAFLELAEACFSAATLPRSAKLAASPDPLAATAAAALDANAETAATLLALLDESAGLGYARAVGAAPSASPPARGSCGDFTRIVVGDVDTATDAFAIDLDGDGSVDVVSASQYDRESIISKVFWHQNDGSMSPGFSEPNLIAGSGSSRFGDVFAIDVDGDGDVDALSASALDTVAWYENDGSQLFTEHVITDSAGTAHSSFTERVITTLADAATISVFAYAIDLDGDGDVARSRHKATSVFAIDVDSDGDVDALSAWNNMVSCVLSSKADGVAAVFAIDVDGDGDVDVLSASYEDDTVAWYENDGSQSFTEHVITDTADYAIFVFAIDADGDGDVDSFTERIISDTADEATFVFAIDVDGDGDVDVLAPDESTSVSDDTIEWFENDGSQSFTDHIVADAADFASSVFAIDVDGDGDVDVLSASMNDDTVAWHENDGSQSFTERIISSTADGVSSIFAIDVDGDGDVDVLASASVYDDTVAWYENDGSQSFTERVITDAADSARSVFAIDVDGDGDSFAERVITTLADAALGVFAIDLDGDGDVDVLSASVYDDAVAWYENDGSQSFTQRVITTLANGAICVFAIDVDGDGDVDVLSASIDDDTVAWYENDAPRTRRRRGPPRRAASGV